MAATRVWLSIVLAGTPHASWPHLHVEILLLDAVLVAGRANLPRDQGHVAGAGRGLLGWYAAACGQGCSVVGVVRTGPEALVSLRRSCGDDVLVDGGCDWPGIWQSTRCGELH